MNKLAQEARALCDVATPGPWVWEHEKGEMWGENGRVDVAVDGEGHGIQMTKEDGDLCARSRTLLPEMAAEIERLESKAQFLTEAYDRQATIHEALTRDYLAVKSERDRFKARAEAAERDFRNYVHHGGESCAFCKHDDECEPGESLCYANKIGWEWRGPQEGANE